MKIRDSKGRFVSGKVMDERLKTLKHSGFCVSYAWRSDAKPWGYLSSSNITGEYYHGHRTLTITGEAHDYYGEPYVSFDSVACGEDTYGQTSSWSRSNFRSIQRDYPTFPWVNTSYSNTDVLGCFVSDLDDDMSDLLVGLAEQYPVYDESDMSQLEQEEIDESWEWLKSDIWRELSEPAQTMWDAVGGDTVQELWWACVSEDVFGNYPEHRGVEVVWGDRAERARDFRPYLIHAYVSVRQGGSLPSAWDMVPMIKKFRDFREGK